MLEEILRSGFSELALELDGRAAERYRIYYENLEETNKVMNLTAISGEADVARLHFLDCAALLGMQDFAGKRVIDVGTGAGFPGLALKIACPEMHLPLLDSLDKRIGFLRDTCAKLGFDDVECVHARAEEFAMQQREQYDIATSRAVAQLSVLSELCLPLVKVGGQFAAMKSVSTDEEIRQAHSAIAQLGGQLSGVTDYTVPETDVVHRIVSIEKTQHTPKQFPRAFARIKKAPLV